MIKRPQTFKDYVGQERVKALVAAELKDGAFPRHMLLYGLPGLGKTSLAGVVAREAGLIFHNWKASKLMTQKRLTNDLMNLSIEGYSRDGIAGPQSPRHLVFIDEVHLLPEFETLYTALEDRVLNPDPNGGISWLPYTCFMVATTNLLALPKAFQDRFPLKFRLDPYNEIDLQKMIRVHFGTVLDCETVNIIARCSRGNARDALNFTESVLRHGLEYFDLMGIERATGLTPLDRDVLAVLNRAGRPISLNTLASMVREDPATLRDVVEPALIAAGLMEITPKGRLSCNLPTTSRGVPAAYAV